MIFSISLVVGTQSSKPLPLKALDVNAYRHHDDAIEFFDYRRYRMDDRHGLASNSDDHGRCNLDDSSAYVYTQQQQ